MSQRRPEKAPTTKLQKIQRRERKHPIGLGTVGSCIGSRIDDECAEWLFQETAKLEVDNAYELTIAAFIALIVRDAWYDELERRAALSSPDKGEE
tara:strand:+ start:12429 stop:12713 length:285 start_codon:yes stop_codon:yes gene_type:complete